MTQFLVADTGSCFCKEQCFRKGLPSGVGDNTPNLVSQKVVSCLNHGPCWTAGSNLWHRSGSDERRGVQSGRCAIHGAFGLVNVSSRVLSSKLVSLIGLISCQGVPLADDVRVKSINVDAPCPSFATCFCCQSGRLSRAACQSWTLLHGLEIHAVRIAGLGTKGFLWFPAGRRSFPFARVGWLLRGHWNQISQLQCSIS